MKRNNKSNIDKQLTDKGWGAMRALLDREMPEDKKRDRKPLIIWWRWSAGIAAVSLPIALLSAWWFMSPSMQGPIEEAPVANVQAYPSTEEMQSAGAPPATTRPLATTDETQPAVAQTTAVAAPTTATDDMQPAVAAPTTATDVTQPAGTPPAVAHHPAATDITQPAGTPTAVAHHPAATDATQPAGATLAVARIQTADTTAMPTFPIVEPVMQDAWSWGVGTGLVANNNLQAGGAALGLTTDWALSEKWGIRTGLTYRHDQPSASARPLSEVSEVAYAEAAQEYGILQDNNVGLNPNATPGSLDPTASATPTVLVPVERLHRVEIPVALRWTPIGRLRLFGGGVVSHLAYAQAATRALTNTRMVLSTQSEYQNDLNKAVTQSLPRWQFDWQLGAGVRLGKRFEINAFYRTTLWEAGSAGLTSGAMNAADAAPEALSNAGVRANSLRAGGGSKLPGTILLGGVLLF